MVNYYPVFSVNIISLGSLMKNHNEMYENIFKKIVNGYEQYLVSYGITSSRKYENLKKKFNIKKMIGDSGGFQLIQKLTVKPDLDVDHITPKNVLNWLEKECDFGLNLDIPPIIQEVGDYKSLFEKCINTSVENFKYFQDNRSNDNLKLYNVLHGKDFNYIDRWYQKVKDFKFEGWAIGIKPNTDSVFMALTLIYLHSKMKEVNINLENYYIHILGTSSYEIVALLNYFNIFCKAKEITFDSSTFTVGSQYTTYYYDLINRYRSSKVPFFFGIDNEKIEKKLNDNNYRTDNIYFDKFVESKFQLPCNCYSCNIWNEYLKKNYNSCKVTTALISMIISLHNMYRTIDVCRDLSIMSENNENIYREFLNDMIRYEKRESLRKGIEIINKYFIQKENAQDLINRYSILVDNKVGAIQNNVLKRVSSLDIDENIFE